MSFLNDETNAKRAAIIAATVVIGGAVTYFLWDRYSTEDQQEWAAKKKQAASNMKNNVSNKVSDLKDSAVEKAEAVKDKVSLYSLYHIS
jgi:membrane protein YqaA with SNARE-associated domain